MADVIGQQQFNCNICGHFGNGIFDRSKTPMECDAWLCERCGAVVELEMLPTDQTDYDAQAKDDKKDFKE